jgi:hypothetical protein
MRQDQPRGEEYNDEPQASVTICHCSNFGYIVLSWVWGERTYRRIRSPSCNICARASRSDANSRTTSSNTNTGAANSYPDSSNRNTRTTNTHARATNCHTNTRGTNTDTDAS